MRGPPPYTRIGAPKSTGTWDFVVAPPGNPYATHNSLQEAVDAAADGDSIKVLEGDYSITVAGNVPVDANAAVSWSGKTLLIEGEGWNTRLINAGALSRAFGVQSGSSTLTAALGNGSVIRNLRVEGFTQSVRFDAQTFGIRFCSVDLWNVAGTAYTAPAVTGTGTSADLTVTEKTYNTALSPTFQVRTYTLQGSTVATESLDANDQYSLTATNVLLNTTFRVASTGGNYIQTVSSATIPQVLVVSHGVGTATPHLGFVGDSDTGFSITAANTLSLLTGGASRLAVSTTAAAFSVPIQVSSTSSALLHLVQTSTGEANLRLQRTGGTASNWEAYLPTGSTEYRLYSGGDRLTLTTAGHLTVSGTVTGTGTTSAALGVGTDRWLFASTAANNFTKFSTTNRILATDVNGWATSIAYTGTTGTGNLVFATNPTISGLSLSNPTLTGTISLPGFTSKWLYTDGSGTVTGFGSPNTNRVLGTGGSGEPTNYTTTGTGNVVRSDSPTLSGSVSVNTIVSSGYIRAAVDGTESAPPLRVGSFSGTATGFYYTTFVSGGDTYVDLRGTVSGNNVGFFRRNLTDNVSWVVSRSDENTNGFWIDNGAGSVDWLMFVNPSINTALRFTGNGAAVLSLETDGSIFLENIGTAGSPANARIHTSTGEITYVSSSIKFKNVIGAVDPSPLYGLRPVEYTSKLPADDPNVVYYGLIAEEVALVDPKLTEFVDGKPVSVQYERLSILLLAEVQRLKALLDRHGIV